MDNEKQAINYIDENAELYKEISHKIWDFAELSLKEYKSASLYEEELRKAGFDVEKGICGIDTAIRASYGEGRPYIGILAEYDALSGLRQKAGETEKTADIGHTASDPGHGCGHNILGAASFAAACAVKNFLQNNKIQGTVMFFGCPGEEGGAAKAFMARDKIWEDLDCALTWHPGDKNEVVTGTCNSCIQVLYKFHGKSAHAAGNPEDGRSALDAVELMNTGVQYLREHMKSDCRIHYALTYSGGISPNVVQSDADVLYMVRSVSVKDSVALLKRVDKIAQGAALMTETTYDRIFVDGTANTVDNRVLEDLLQQKLEEVGPVTFSEEEKEYAAKLFLSYKEDNGKVFNEQIEPLDKERVFTAGSTDVGDVSWQTPTAQFNTVCEPCDAPGHSWQIVSCSNSTIGDKGMINAAKVLACASITLFENPDILKKAREEFSQATKSGYCCPIPTEAEPYVIEI